MARETRQILGFSSREMRGILIILAAALIALAILGMPEKRAGFSSVEVQFSDPSTSGLAIVPASCPSQPAHFQGDSGTNTTQGCSTCTAGHFCSGNDRYYRTATCSQQFVETCPYGCSNGLCLDGPQCDDNDPGCTGQCSPQYFCFGAELYFRNSQCDDSFIQTCFYGCTAGSCNVAPSGTLNIQVSPAVVRSGEPTTVSWTSSGMESCTVAEDNPEINDAWSGTSGTQRSGAITQRTSYTLSCRDEEGNVFTDSAMVNILPAWEEQ